MQGQYADTATLGLPELHNTGQQSVDALQLDIPNYSSTHVHFQLLRRDAVSPFVRQQQGALVTLMYCV